ncbi:MAG: DUF2961 domain-containing protein, partial [Planctomycetes bacterium]|nr:DUF2961 domain-containing protein [Planctomycetota bacterium]
MKRLLCLAAVGLLCAATASAAEKLTYVDLVKRLTDLERLAVLPAAGDTCAQWSSYDRASKFDEASGKYVGWDANGDGGGIIRRDGEQAVFAEMKGPGCIWRIWSAEAKGGHVKIYLDGAAEPAVDLAFAGYFDGKNAPFVYPSLVHMTAKGINNYVPIPYQKSCKIVADKDWGNYYQFVYETFPEGTQVPTFTRNLSPDETAALKAADEMMTQKLGTDPAGGRDGEKTLTKAATIGAGKTAEIARLEGEGAITALRVKVDGVGGDREDEILALRELVLRITWDGADAPAVWCPLGDFFGTAPGANLYKSLPLGMTDDGFYALWYMPFAKGAKVEIANEGAAARKVEVRLAHAPLKRPAAELGRFHARWHRDAFLPEEPERLRIDWTMLKTAGRGRYCGVALFVWNPRGGWWGEGDEKFFVDGEKFPSTIGTGSEDYFGYAWCTPELFQNAYHNQTIVQGWNKGHISVNRWHIADNTPFQKSFEAAIEKYYPNNKPTLYAATVYWYQDGPTDAYKTVAAADRTGYYVAPEPNTVKGALEGEAMKVLEKTGGDPKPQDMDGYGATWSGDCHLWWTGAKPDDRLVLEVTVKEAGKYKVVVNLTKAIDYGIVQLALDDKKLGGPIDLFNDGVVATGPIDLGVVELAAGSHRLTLQITGANEKAVKAYMVGL